MKRRVLVVAALAGLLPVAGATTPASATNACVNFTTVTFSPALTVSSGSGTGTLTNNHICEGLPAGSNTLPLTYTGTCSEASIAVENWVGVLTSGTVLTLVNVSHEGVAAYALQPDNACNETLAIGVGVGAVVQ